MSSAIAVQGTRKEVSGDFAEKWVPTVTTDFRRVSITIHIVIVMCNVYRVVVSLHERYARLYALAGHNPSEHHEYTCEKQYEKSLVLQGPAGPPGKNGFPVFIRIKLLLWTFAFVVIVHHTPYPR